MPVIGAERILCQDYANFEPLLLHNGPVVVDGENFIYWYRSRDPKSYIYGGEYLSMAVYWKRILFNFKDCSIEPLFIFTSAAEKRGQQLEYQLSGIKKHFGALQHLRRLRIQESVSLLPPVLSCSVLVDLFELVHVSHLCSPFSNLRSCSSMANCMRCPLMANEPEYLLLCAPMPHLRYPGFQFIPLQVVDLQPVKLNYRIPGVEDNVNRPSINEEPVALSVHRFIPENSSIAKADTRLRPLLFLLLGTDSLPRIRLPNAVYNIINEKDGTDYKTRRWKAIHRWLYQLSNDVSRMIKMIGDCYPVEMRHLVEKTIMDAMLTYIPDHAIGRRLASFLVELTDVTTERKNVPKSSPKPLCENCSTEANRGIDWNKEICAVINGSSCTDQLLYSDITLGWPARLLRAFHQSKLANFLLSAIYSPKGLILPNQIENLSVESSIWDASMRLRLLHYCYLTGLEHNLGQIKKLRRLNPQAIEYVRHKEEIVCYKIRVVPLFVNLQIESTDDILYKSLGVPIDSGLSTCGPLTGLIITLILWHQWNQKLSKQIPSLEASPTALAVLLCAAANQFNGEPPNDTLLRHCEASTAYAEQLSLSGSPQNGPMYLPHNFNLNLIHAFNCIQSTYLCLRSATYLIDQLVAESECSKLMRFPPIWKIFPSGKLVHWISVSLGKEDVKLRRQMAARHWLPRLCYQKGPTDTVEIEVNRATKLFNAALDTALRILPLTISGLKVEFQEEKVPPTDFDKFQSIECVNLVKTKMTDLSKSRDWTVHAEHISRVHDRTKHICTPAAHLNTSNSRSSSTNYGLHNQSHDKTSPTYFARLTERLRTSDQNDI